MRIIKSVSDIRKLKNEGSISEKLAKHIEAKVVKLRDILEPKLDMEVFSLDVCGNIGLFEKGDRDFAAIGIVDELKNITPEWISKVCVATGNYYIFYFIANNDCVVQIYVPETLVNGELSEWINSQDIDDEKAGGEGAGKYNMPF